MSPPIAIAHYHMASPELEELKKPLKEMLDVGFIQHLKASYGVPMLFQKKHDWTLQLCCCAMNLSSVHLGLFFKNK